MRIAEFEDGGDVVQASGEAGTIWRCGCGPKGDLVGCRRDVHFDILGKDALDVVRGQVSSKEEEMFGPRRGGEGRQNIL